MSARRYTERGFRIFLEDHDLRVVESSKAGEGAHVRVFEGTSGHVQLDVAGARQVIAALQHFVDEAELGVLTEPVQR